MTPTEKYSAIVQQALIDAAREFFAKKAERVRTD
jgi:hypothetical protein